MGELVVVLASLATLAVFIGLRWQAKRNAPPGRLVAPKASQTPKPPETEHERLIRALATMGQRAEERMDSLKWFLFWLPFIWGVIYGIIWIIVIEMRRP